MFDGDRISRTELFDESDVVEALACFEAIQASARRPGNAASRLYERFKSYYAARDLQAIGEMFADNVCTEDRRRVVNAGLLQGKDAVLEEISALAELNVDLMTDVIATRGTRLVLSRVQASGSDQGSDGFYVVGFDILELDADGRAVARVVFDLDDSAAALKELDARFVAGEAAAHAATWSVIAGVHAMFNRHELPPADWVTIDHRRGTPFTASDMTSAIHTLFDLTPDFQVHIETVHHLNSFGAVITNYAHGSSPDGLDVEWRMVMLHIVDGDRLTRCEVFDETDADAALARLDELSQPTARLANAASRVVELFWSYFAARQWDSMAEVLTEDSCVDDRRTIVNAGTWKGRDAVITNMRALSEPGLDVTLTVVATRGERLALYREATHDLLHEEFGVEMLTIVDIDDDDRIAAHIAFDLEDIHAAFNELDARYLAGEASAHAHAWSVIARAYAGFNRHEIAATAPNSVAIEHRPLLTTEPADLATSIHAVWNLTPHASMYIEAVHRLSELGVVVTQLLKGTSPEGLNAEWRMVIILTVAETDGPTRSLRRDRPRRRPGPVR